MTVVQQRGTERLLLYLRMTRREREIVNVLFALGNRASVEDIRSRLDAPPGDSAVRVMLARLEEKGVVRRQQDGIRNISSATISPAPAGVLQRMLRPLLARHFRLEVRRETRAIDALALVVVDRERLGPRLTKGDDACERALGTSNGFARAADTAGQRPQCGILPGGLVASWPVVWTWPRSPPCWRPRPAGW